MFHDVPQIGKRYITRSLPVWTLTLLVAWDSSQHCEPMYSRPPCAAAQHHSPVPTQRMRTEDVLISCTVPINRGRQTHRSRLSKTQRHEPYPRISGRNHPSFGSGSTGLPDSDDRLHSGLADSLLASTPYTVGHARVSVSVNMMTACEFI